MTGWQHDDRVLETFRRRGIAAHILIKVYNKIVWRPSSNSLEKDPCFRWLLNPAIAAVLVFVLSHSGALTHAQTSLRQQCSVTQLLVEHDAMLYAPYLTVGNEGDPDHIQSAAYFKLSRLDGEKVELSSATYGAYVDDHWVMEAPAALSPIGQSVDLRLTSENLKIDQVRVKLDTL